MSKIEKTGFGKSFLDGLFYKNPFFVLFLGLTLVRISTTRLETALIIGVIAGIELIITQLVLCLLRKHLDKVGAYLTALVIAAGLSTLFGRVLGLCFSSVLKFVNVNGSNGKFLAIAVPFLCTSSFILDQADEALFHPLSDTMGYSLGSFLGFLLALVLISLFREILSTGCITFTNGKGQEFGPVFWNKKVFSLSILDKPFGGFLFAGLLMGIYRSILDLVLTHQDKKKKMKLEEAE